VSPTWVKALLLRPFLRNYISSVVDGMHDLIVTLNKQAS